MPTPDDQPAAPRWTVTAVARLLGVAPATLRTWDRRYGVGPSAHEFGQHRRYTEEDVARLQGIRRLTVAGVSPADAARAVTGAAVDERVHVGPHLVQPEGETPSAPPSGGRVLALPRSAPDVRGLARAAMALDATAATAAIRAAVRERGAAAAWHELVAPVLIAVGERWQATGEGVDVEHLLAECALAAVRSAASAAQVDGTPRVMLAAAAEDFHSLPLHVLAAALAERGIAVRNLGGAVPPTALSSAVRRVGPAALFLWSSLRRTGDPRGLAAVPVTVPSAAVVVGGPGWWLEDLPSTVAYARDVPHAVELIEQRIGLARLGPANHGMERPGQGD